MAFPIVNIRGHWEDAGVAAKGYVDFKRSASIQDAATNAISPNDSRRARLNSAGNISINLEATDDPGTAPANTTYRVTEHINGAKRSYSIDVLTADVAAGIELADRAPVTPGPVVLTYALASALTAEVARAEAAEDALQADIDAKPDDFLSLTDTPNAYTGQGGKVVAVKSDVSGLEFIAGGGGGGGASLSDANPVVNGTAAAGVGTLASRDDHVHPHDTAAGVGADPAGTGATQAASAVSAHVAAADPHTQYHNNARGDARYDALGAASTVQANLNTHAAAADPHSQYLTQLEADDIYMQLGSANPSDDPPNPLGPHSAGTSPAFSRGDHVHDMPSASDVGALDEGTADTLYLLKAGNLADMTNSVDARANLGLGNLATQNNPMTTQDDVIVGGASGALSRLAKGSDRQRLTVDPTTHHLVWADTTEADLTLADNTTNNVTSTKHGFAPKAPANAAQFLNGAATPAYAAVKDSDLSTSDITTNDASTTKHGFVPKLPNDATKYYDGTGAYSVPAGGSSTGFSALMASVMDYLAGNNSDPIDTKLTSGSYVALVYFTSNNTNSWKGATNATHTVAVGKKAVLVYTGFSSKNIEDTSGGRNVRLQNTTDTATVIAALTQYQHASPYYWDGDLATASKFPEVAAGKTIRIEVLNTDTNKRASGAFVIFKEV